MTRDESKLLTKIKIKKAINGKEVSDAIIAHFRAFKIVSEKKESDYSDALKIFDGNIRTK